MDTSNSHGYKSVGRFGLRADSRRGFDLSSGRELEVIKWIKFSVPWEAAM